MWGWCNDTSRETSSTARACAAILVFNPTCTLICLRQLYINWFSDMTKLSATGNQISSTNDFPPHSILPPSTTHKYIPNPCSNDHNPIYKYTERKKILLIPLHTKWPSRFGDKLYYLPPCCKPLKTPSPIFLPPIKIANTSAGHVWFVALILIFIPKLSLLYASSRPIFTALLLHTKCAQREEGRREMKSRKRGKLHYSTFVQPAMNMHDNNLTLQRIIL